MFKDLTTYLDAVTKALQFLIFFTIIGYIIYVYTLPVDQQAKEAEITNTFITSFVTNIFSFHTKPAESHTLIGTLQTAQYYLSIGIIILLAVYVVGMFIRRKPKASKNAREENQ